MSLLDVAKVVDPTKVVKLAQDIVVMGRDIAAIKFSRKDVSLQMEALEPKLSDMKENLARLSSWLRDGGQSSCSQISHEYQYLKSNIKQLLDDVNNLQARVQNINEKRKGGLFPKFPSLTKKPIDEINEKISSIQEGSNDFYEKIKEFTSSGEGPVTGLDGDDKFVRVTDMVPDNPEDMYFDFASTDTDGKPLTCAGKLKAAILDESQRQTKSVVAHGIGGSGKTCALRAIGQEEEIKNRFNGGVLYISLGADAGETQLKDQIAKIVARAGGCNRAKEILELNRLDDVVDNAVPWFSRHSCLFLIDDIWQRGGITKESLVTLANLAKHYGSRLAYTMQDVKLRCGMSVDFTPQASSSAESKYMLLRNAKLEYPSSEQARQSFDAILVSCGGLPLALSIAGRAVRDLASKKSARNREEAWHKYDSVWKMGEEDDCDDMSRRLLKSLYLIDPDTDIHLRRFEAMGVLRKCQNLSLRTLSTLWNVDIFVAEKEVKVLNRFSIVRCFDDDSGESVAGLHDIILDISRARAGDSLQSHSLGLIKRHLTNINRDDADEASHGSTGNQGRELTSEEFRQEALAIGSDKSMLSNLCWLLKLGGMKAELLWLVSQPWWIVKRLNEENRREVLGDVEMAAEVLSDISIKSREEQVARDWLYRLTNCLQLSMSSVISSGQRSMAWFQLYGRLMYSESKNSLVREFVQRIEVDVPKPWMKPVYGCLPPAGENLKTVVDTPGVVLHFAYQGGLISVIWVTRTELVNTVHDADHGTELERYVLATDLSEFNIRTSFSNDCKTFVCGTSDGMVRVWTFPTQAAYREESNIECYDSEITSHQASVEKIEPVSPKASKMAKLGLKITSKLKRSKNKKNGSEAASIQDSTSKYHVEANVLLKTDKKGTNNETRHERRIETGEKVKRWDCSELAGQTELISSVAISSDGKVVVSGSWDDTVRVWENREGKWEEGHCLTGHTNCISDVAISTDGKKVVTKLSDDTMRVWNNLDGKWDEGHSLTGHSSYIVCVAISTDGKQVVSGSFDNTVGLWNNLDGKWDEGHSLTGHTASIRCVAISTDGKKVVSGSDDRTVRVWENRGGKWDEGYSLTGHTDIINCVAISTDGKRIVSGSDDCTVRVWENVDGKWDEGHSLTGHTDSIDRVALISDGKEVVSGSYDGTVRVWENVGGMSDVEHSLTGHTAWISCVAISTDVKLVVSGSRDETVRVWENRDGKWDEGHSLTGHTASIECVAISTDGKRIVSGSHDTTVRVWENVDGKWDERHSLTGHTDIINCVAISTDVKRIVSGSDDCTVRVWENVDGKWDEGHSLIGHSSLIKCVAFSTDGKLVVSGSWDDTVRVWGNMHGKWDEGHCLTGHTDMIRCVAISTDGKKIVSGATDNTVWVWENREGKWDEGHCLTGHSGWIRCVAISSDGKKVVSGARDNTVWVWESREGKWDEGHALIGHSDWIRCVSISTDGKCIKSEGENGTNLQWRKGNDVWLPSTEVQTCCADVETGSSQPTLYKPTFEGLQRTVKFNLESELDLRDGRNHSEVEDIVEILDIGVVTDAVGAVQAWRVSSGFCLKLRRPPFLLFINLEE